MTELLTSQAERLTAEGKLEQAIGVYQQLYNETGLEVWRFNIAFLSRQLQESERQHPEENIDATHQLASHPPLAEEFACASWQEYTGEKELGVLENVEKIPMVSIIMTTYNAEASVEKVINNLLFQSYPRIEIVVCDDASTDNTWTILRDISARSPRTVKVHRLGINSGTYLAKNRAIVMSRGEILLFQDSDDYSHPDRALVQAMPLIRNQKLIGTRSMYLRYSPETGRVVPVGAFLSRFGMITLAIRRSVIDEIGYFAPVRRAGDYEWSQRAQLLYGKDKIKPLKFTGYLAEFRAGSLTDDLLKLKADGTIEQLLSKDRQRYVEQFERQFEDKNKGAAWYRTNFPPSPLRSVEKYPPTIDALSHMTTPVYGAVFSSLTRTKQLRDLVRELLPQLDHLFVYIDGSQNDIPEFLKKSKVSVCQGDNCDSLPPDGAKFGAFNDLKKTNAHFYYFTFDDAIIYPPEYTRTLIQRILAFENAIICGVHGAILEERPRHYLDSRMVYHHSDTPLRVPQLVNIVGTGTLAFHSDLFESIDPRLWASHGTAEVAVSISAREKKIPMLCIERHAGWLKEKSSSPDDNAALYRDFISRTSEEIAHLNEMNPWGYQSITEAVDAQTPKLRDRLRSLLPAFSTNISAGDIVKRIEK